MAPVLASLSKDSASTVSIGLLDNTKGLGCTPGLQALCAFKAIPPRRGQRLSMRISPMGSVRPRTSKCFSTFNPPIVSRSRFWGVQSTGNTPA